MKRIGTLFNIPILQINSTISQKQWDKKQDGCFLALSGNNIAIPKMWQFDAVSKEYDYVVGMLHKLGKSKRVVGKIGTRNIVPYIKEDGTDFSQEEITEIVHSPSSYQQKYALLVKVKQTSTSEQGLSITQKKILILQPMQPDKYTTLTIVQYMQSNQ